ncbi:MAG TPA: hypothetical protein VK416_05110 [Thermoanaerobaculia bacterium]|nr:hypothetical protein [Thermoanaerobaculia bacterium]
MVEIETPAEHQTQVAAPKRRRAPARRKTPSRRAKAPARRKQVGSRARATARSLSALLDGWSTRATAAGKGLKTLSGQGTDAARKAFRGAGAASKKTIARLAKEWEGMDTKRRTQFVAALLAALAAASAPIVRIRMKK